MATVLLRDATAFRKSLIRAPMTLARSISFSSAMTSSTASAAAQATGLPHRFRQATGFGGVHPIGTTDNPESGKPPASDSPRSRDQARSMNFRCRTFCRCGQSRLDFIGNQENAMLVGKAPQRDKQLVGGGEETTLPLAPAR